jgi:hypothetical protein
VVACDAPNSAIPKGLQHRSEQVKDPNWGNVLNPDTICVHAAAVALFYVTYAAYARYTRYWLWALVEFWAWSI